MNEQELLIALNLGEVIQVPRASRRQRPVYVGQNPLDGTYRRNYEGDYKCRPDEVGRMLADQAEESLDYRIVERFGVNDLDQARTPHTRRTPYTRARLTPYITCKTSRKQSFRDCA
jgi:hypothetical protein